MPLDREETKAVLKEALKEWLDEQAAKFGRWSLFGFASMAIAALAYFILRQSGWELTKGIPGVPH